MKERRQSMTMELGMELVALNKTVARQDIAIDELMLKAAMYKASFFGKHELSNKLSKQIEENYDSCVGEWDGVCFASWRARAVYRSIHDMLEDGLITEEEYRFCKV